ncbi:MAG: alpha/beta fold hydrolase [Nocardiopsaceae bacterium]|nr:alpha/beta fold hydrolase [Nocardiopsaceae bacterium]
MGLAYDRRGQGPELVLLHGLGHRRQAWNAVLDLLTPHRHVITVDLPGHGDSPPLKTNGTDPVEAMGAELIATLEELGVGRPHVAGNSLGGALALGAAARGRAKSVTALSPAGFWAADWQYHYTKAVFGTLKAGRPLKPWMPRLAQTTAGRAFMHGAVVARPSRMTPEQAIGDAEAFYRATETVDEVLASKRTFTEAAAIPADVPVTIAWAEKDRVLLPSQARVAKRQLPGATFILLRGCGHVPMTDDPRSIARILLRGSEKD